jgi:DNA-binding transcriptional LysR family regulator
MCRLLKLWVQHRWANRLGVTPTAISKAIRQLEKRHGVSLFQRTTRRVSLTEAGHAIFLRLRPAAAEIVDAFVTLSGFRERPMGTLRITAPLSASYLLFLYFPERSQTQLELRVFIDMLKGFRQ